MASTACGRAWDGGFDEIGGTAHASHGAADADPYAMHHLHPDDAAATLGGPAPGGAMPEVGAVALADPRPPR